MTWAWVITPAVIGVLIAVDLLLVFIGVKMVISPFVRLPIALSLAVIIAVVGGAVAASLWRDRGRAPRRRPRLPAEPARE